MEPVVHGPMGFGPPPQIKCPIINHPIMTNLLCGGGPNPRGLCSGVQLSLNHRTTRGSKQPSRHQRSKAPAGFVTLNFPIYTAASTQTKDLCNLPRLKKSGLKLHRLTILGFSKIKYRTSRSHLGICRFFTHLKSVLLALNAYYRSVQGYSLFLLQQTIYTSKVKKWLIYTMKRSIQTVLSALPTQSPERPNTIGSIHVAKPPSGRSTLSYACILVNVIVEILLNCNIISDYKK